MDVHIEAPAGEEVGDRGASYDGGTDPSVLAIRDERVHEVLDLIDILVVIVNTMVAGIMPTGMSPAVARARMDVGQVDRSSLRQTRDIEPDLYPAGSVGEGGDPAHVGISSRSERDLCLDGRLQCGHRAQD